MLKAEIGLQDYLTTGVRDLRRMVKLGKQKGENREQ
jgi:hypothetical protein